MSSNDGGHGAREDLFRSYQRTLVNSNDLQRGRQEELHAATGVIDDHAMSIGTHQVMWANNNLDPPQHFIHQIPPQIPLPLSAPTFTPPHLQPLQQKQQQQCFNELILNMQPGQAYMQNTGQPETYSVLPVGHGNFLKVYHCSEPTDENGNNRFVYHSQRPLHQPPAQHIHLPMQLEQKQQQLIIQPQLHHITPQVVDPSEASASPPSEQVLKPMPQVFNRYELFSSNTLLPVARETHAKKIPCKPVQLNMFENSSSNNLNVLNGECMVTDTVNTTNTIINKLVNNWSPNLTGGTYTQFSALISSPPQLPLSGNENAVLEVLPDTLQKQLPHISTSTIRPPIVKRTIPAVNAAPKHQTLPLLATEPIFLGHSTPSAKSQTSSTSINTASVKSSVGERMAGPEVKKRIVAAVKPMRMTYSDVLSKLNLQQKNSTSGVVLMTSSNVKSGQTLSRNGKPLGMANEQLGSERKYVEAAGANGISIRRTLGGRDDGRNIKKSPVHEQKDIANAVKSSKRYTNYNSININNNGQQKKNGQKSALTAKQTLLIEVSSNNINSTSTNNNNIAKKRTTSNYANNSSKETNAFNSKKPVSTAEKENTFFERVSVTRKTNSKSSHSNGQGNTAPSTYTRTRCGNMYLNSHTNAGGGTNSYSYFSKRSRSVSYFHTSMSSTTVNASYGGYNSNRNYELAKKLLLTWCEYMLKVLTWLFYLVYDIVVIGCGMVYDRMKLGASTAWTHLRQLRTELHQNSNKPGLWWRRFCRLFDARFAKNSRWSFWRRFYPKKTQQTATTDSFKGGRLPQTGEEAMFSLLNCKGKNAYR